MKNLIVCAILIAVSAGSLGAEFKVEGENYRFYAMKGGKYDPAVVETVKGKISAIETFKLSEVCTGFIHLELLNASETIRIILAPGRYLNGKIAIEKGDTVEITGSRLANDAGEKLIIARFVKKDAIEVNLRDEKGRPLWPVRKK